MSCSHLGYRLTLSKTSKKYMEVINGPCQAAKVISQRKTTELGMTDKIRAVYLKDNNRTE